MIVDEQRLLRLLETVASKESPPTLEIGGWHLAAMTGGGAVLPWREHYLAAKSSGVLRLATLAELSDHRFEAAMVHIDKGRAATDAAFKAAWNHLENGAAIDLIGFNELGIKSVVKRLEAKLGQPGELLGNRSKGRVVRFRRSEDDDAFPLSVATSFDLDVEGRRLEFLAEPGVFSAGELDPASRLLLDHLEVGEAIRITDLACGCGVLGLVALARARPSARLCLADADARAVVSAQLNAERFGFQERSSACWWDARLDPIPTESADLVVCNPPFHRGFGVDHQPARAIFKTIDRILSGGGRALIVANRKLPWEIELQDIGLVRVLVQSSGFKLLEVEKPER